METNKHERRLLIEDRAGVKRIKELIYDSAKRNCELVNIVHAVRPMRTVDECSRALRNCTKLWHEILKSSDERIARDSDILPIEVFKVPDHLKAAERVLKKSYVLSPQHLRFNDALDKWEVDEEAVLFEMNEEIDANQYRLYATEPYQFKRIEMAEKLCAWLKEEKIHNMNAHRRFDGILNYEGATDTWSVNPRWVLEPEGSLDAGMGQWS